MAAITDQSALIVAIPLLVVGPGAVTRRASSRRRWTYYSHFILLSFAGGWPATTVAPMKVGALTTSTFTSAISLERRRRPRRYLHRPRLQQRLRCHQVLRQRPQLQRHLQLFRDPRHHPGLARLSASSDAVAAWKQIRNRFANALRTTRSTLGASAKVDRPL